MKLISRIFECVLISLFVLSCANALDDPQEFVDEENFFYSVNEVSHDIKTVALYHLEGAGFNLVISDQKVPLVGGYNELSNREFNLLSIDFAEDMLSIVADASDRSFDTDQWHFFISSWDVNDFAESKSDKEREGTFFVDLDSDILTVDINLTTADGDVYVVKYSGKYTSFSEYIWSGFLSRGSISVNSFVDYISFDDVITLYSDKSMYGLNSRIRVGSLPYILDIPSFLIGKKVVAGVDDMTAYKDSDRDRFDWTLVFGYMDKSNEVWLSDAAGDFVEGYFDCHFVDEKSKEIAFDLSMITADKVNIDFHYYGPYDVASEYQELR